MDVCKHLDVDLDPWRVLDARLMDTCVVNTLVYTRLSELGEPSGSFVSGCVNAHCGLSAVPTAYIHAFAWTPCTRVTGPSKLAVASRCPAGGKMVRMPTLLNVT